METKNDLQLETTLETRPAQAREDQRLKTNLSNKSRVTRARGLYTIGRKKITYSFLKWFFPHLQFIRTRNKF